MSLEFTPHILPLLGVSLLSAMLLPVAWANRRDRIAYWFGATLVALFVWSVGYSTEIMAVTLEDKVFLANIQFLAIPTIVLCWWEVVRRHVGLRDVPRAVTAALWTIPALTAFMAFVNPWHLFRGDPYIESASLPFLVLHADYGPWYWAVVAPTVTLVSLAALFTLGRAFVNSDRFLRRQHALLFFALLLPLIGNYLYTFDLTPWRDYNSAVILLGFSCLLVAYALFRCQLLAMVPLAREKVVEDLGDPVIIVDRMGRLVDLNRSAERITGLDLRSNIAHQASEALAAHPQLTDLLQTDRSAFEGDVGPEGEDRCDPTVAHTDLSIEGPNGPRYFAVTCSPVRTSRGDYLGKVIVMHDVTEREMLLEQTRKLANHDDLTGLLSRRYFFELTEKEVERSRRHSIPLSFLLMDIDHFKSVNDTFGHRVGDSLLQELAEACTSTLRTSDLLGRVGGEEFAVLLPETDLEEAIEVAARLREVVETLSVTVDEGGETMAITASVGLAQLDYGRPQGMDTFQCLYERTDKALYAAKRSGRNVVVACREASGLLAVV